jgi:hypothetical protein
MKKWIVYEILFFVLTVQQIHSQEYSGKITNYGLDDQYYYEFNQYSLRALGDISARFAPISEYSFFLLDFGFGIGMDIYPHLLSPGIYLDIGIGADWFSLFISDDDSNKTKQEKEKEKEKIPQLGLSTGLRIYNIINIYNFNIIPFFGYNFVLPYYPLPNSGLSLSFKNFAIEFAYYIPTSYMPISNFHFAIKVTMNENFERFFW